MSKQPEVGDEVKFAVPCAYDNTGEVIDVADWGKSWTARVQWPNGSSKWYRASQLKPVGKIVQKETTPPIPF